MSKPSAEAQRARIALADVEKAIELYQKDLDNHTQQVTELGLRLETLRFRKNDLLFIIHGDKAAQPAEAPPEKRKYTRKKKTTVENEPPTQTPPADPTDLYLKYICGQGHKFNEPGKQKVKGAGTVPCCPVPDCGDLDIKEIK